MFVERLSRFWGAMRRWNMALNLAVTRFVAYVVLKYGCEEVCLWLSGDLFFVFRCKAICSVNCA